MAPRCMSDPSTDYTFWIWQYGRPTESSSLPSGFWLTFSEFVLSLNQKSGFQNAPLSAHIHKDGWGDCGECGLYASTSPMSFDYKDFVRDHSVIMWHLRDGVINWMFKSLHQMPAPLLVMLSQKCYEIEANLELVIAFLLAGHRSRDW